MSKHIYISQSERETNTPNSVVKKIYDMITRQEQYEGGAYDDETLFHGNIALDNPTYKEWADKVTQTFPRLVIESLYYMLFKDSNVEQIMINYLRSKGVGDGYGITYDDAKDRRIYALTNTLFRNNTSIEYFNEFANFENITTLVSECFKGCTNLKEIDISNINTLDLSNSQQFTNCSNLQKITLGNISIISSNCFNQCSSLETVENSENIINIRDKGFYQCSYLENIDLQNCTSIGEYGFYQCIALKTVNLLNIVSLGKSCFTNCSKLTITYPLSKCTTIGNDVFIGCTSISSIDLPVCTTIGGSAFKNLSQLLSINIPNVSTISASVFESCTSLSTVTANPTIVGSYAFKQCKMLTDINLTNCTEIGNESFNMCDRLNLTNYNLSNVITVGFMAFYNCIALSHIDLSNCTSVGYNAFRGCTSLITVDLSSCTSIGTQGFRDCTALTTMAGIENIVNNSTDHQVFQNCKNLVFPETITINSSYIGYRAFQECKLHKVILGSNVTALYNSVFTNCTQLTKIEGLEHITNIGAYIFWNCSNLEGVIDFSNVIGAVPGNRIDGAEQGGYGGIFSGCSKITKVIIGYINRIGGMAYHPDESPFYNCTNLHTVEINSLNSFIISDNQMFLKCPNFKNLVIRASSVPTVYISNTTLARVTWSSNISGNVNANIYVPDNLVDAYKATDGFNKFPDHILPISQYVPITD